jgi:hypothetical protein
VILDVVRSELRDHPGKAIAAFVATVLAVPVIYVLYVFFAVALDRAGVPR